MKTYDKITNFISNSSKPFTVKQITNELSLSYFAVSQCLPKILSKGHIKLFGFRKNAKVYVLNSDQENLCNLMNSYEKILNFALSSSKPFTVKMISDELDLSPPVVRKNLRDIYLKGHIKQVKIVKNAKMYISTYYQGNITSIMTNYDKINNAINFSNLPFTTEKIALEIGLPYGMVKRHIRTLRKEGFIKQVYIENGFKVYISKIYEGNIPDKKNGYNKIKNFIYYTDKPFTTKKVICELEIDYESVRKYLPMLVKEGYIKLIGKDKGLNVYIRNKHYKKKATY